MAPTTNARMRQLRARVIKIAVALVPFLACGKVGIVGRVLRDGRGRPRGL